MMVKCDNCGKVQSKKPTGKQACIGCGSFPLSGTPMSPGEVAAAAVACDNCDYVQSAANSKCANCGMDPMKSRPSTTAAHEMAIRRAAMGPTATGLPRGALDRLTQ